MKVPRRKKMARYSWYVLEILYKIIYPVYFYLLQDDTIYYEWISAVETLTSPGHFQVQPTDFQVSVL